MEAQHLTANMDEAKAQASEINLNSFFDWKIYLFGSIGKGIG